MKNSRNGEKKKNENQFDMLYSFYYIWSKWNFLVCVCVWILYVVSLPFTSIEYITFVIESNKEVLSKMKLFDRQVATWTVGNFENLKKITSNFKRIAWEVWSKRAKEFCSVCLLRKHTDWKKWEKNQFWIEKLQIGREKKTVYNNGQRKYQRNDSGYCSYGLSPNDMLQCIYCVHIHTWH